MLYESIMLEEITKKNMIKIGQYSTILWAFVIKILAFLMFHCKIIEIITLPIKFLYSQMHFEW